MLNNQMMEQTIKLIVLCLFIKLNYLKDENFMSSFLDKCGIIKLGIIYMMIKSLNGDIDIFITCLVVYQTFLTMCSVFRIDDVVDYDIS